MCPKKQERSPHSLCKPLNCFAWRDEGGRGCWACLFLAVSLPVYEACFSLTVSGIKRANPSETSDESFKRNNERHAAWGCISGWTYSGLERNSSGARQAAEKRRNITASLAATPSSLTINHAFCLRDINKYAAENIRKLARRVKRNILQLVLLKKKISEWSVKMTGDRTDSVLGFFSFGSCWRRIKMPSFLYEMKASHLHILWLYVITGTRAIWYKATESAFGSSL